MLVSVFEGFQEWKVPRLGGGPLITDAHNPSPSSARLGSAVGMRHHAVMREMYPAEFCVR